MDSIYILLTFAIVMDKYIYKEEKLVVVASGILYTCDIDRT